MREDQKISGYDTDKKYVSSIKIKETILQMKEIDERVQE